MGLSIGVITSLSVLFEFTKDLDPIFSWGTMSILLIIFAFVLVLMIKEPKIVKKDKDEPVLKQMKTLSVLLY